MDHPVARATGKGSRFELAPPRRFVLPAVLLLLSERPGYGYELVARLEDFHFGHVDRPAVYRALGQLEADGLAQASSESGSVGQARRVYTLTSLGQRTLRVWMGVIKEEHDYLGQVLRRYQETGTADAVLAEVEGGWASALRVGLVARVVDVGRPQAPRARRPRDRWRGCRGGQVGAGPEPRPCRR